MAQFIIMPRQGQSVESCIIAKIHKKKGDPVSTGDLLFTYETDKATFDETSRTDGALLDFFYKEGDDVPCLANVCVIGRPGEAYTRTGAGSAAPAEQSGTAEAAGAAARQLVTADAAARQAETAAREVNTGKISPRARNLAERAGADPSLATPTGPKGRVITRDIEALLISGAAPALTAGDVSEPKPAPAAKALETGASQTEAPAPANDYELVKLSNIRKSIAKTMYASISNMAQLTLNTSFDAGDIQNWRAKLKEKGPALNLPDITLGDIVLYAVSRVLPGYRELNAHFTDEGLKLFSHVNLGVAVDTERGLMVPTLFSAESMSLRRLSGEVRRMAAACRSGSISPDETAGGTFTVTNLGTLGIESFTPINNPPQTGILGVCAVVERPRTVNGQIQLYPAIGLSLTIDHRAVDGAPASRFLRDLVNYLESFSLNIAF